MEFEFDNKKSLSNKQKHGIDFREAQKLWLDLNRIEIPILYVDEQRFLLIGMIENIFWSAIFTIRENKIRIISVRRSRKNEKKIYKSRRV